MEFDFAVPGIAAEGITVWDSRAVRKLASADADNLETLLATFGKRSASAQGLPAAITDIHRLRSTDQRLYLHAVRHAGRTRVSGGLKVGTKKLFVRTADSNLQEIQPQCVLDFYVHESCQRQGIGKQLFQAFLSQEQQDPGAVAYDRPSPKLLAFLQRHFGLTEYVPQNNNFVVFQRYWQLHPPASTLGSSRRPNVQAPPAALSQRITAPPLSQQPGRHPPPSLHRSQPLPGHPSPLPLPGLSIPPTPHPNLECDSLSMLGLSPHTPPGQQPPSHYTPHSVTPEGVRGWGGGSQQLHQQPHQLAGSRPPSATQGSWPSTQQQHAMFSHPHHQPPPQQQQLYPPPLHWPPQQQQQQQQAHRQRQQQQQQQVVWPGSADDQPLAGPTRAPPSYALSPPDALDSFRSQSHSQLPGSYPAAAAAPHHPHPSSHPAAGPPSSSGIPASQGSSRAAGGAPYLYDPMPVPGSEAWHTAITGQSSWQPPPQAAGGRQQMHGQARGWPGQGPGQQEQQQGQGGARLPAGLDPPWGCSTGDSQRGREGQLPGSAAYGRRSPALPPASHHPAPKPAYSYSSACTPPPYATVPGQDATGHATGTPCASATITTPATTPPYAASASHCQNHQLHDQAGRQLSLLSQHMPQGRQGAGQEQQQGQRQQGGQGGQGSTPQSAKAAALAARSGAGAASCLVW
ncbi:touch receptor neuron protein Mec-17-domain-containing protein [Haematococcus lacustris]